MSKLTPYGIASRLRSGNLHWNDSGDEALGFLGRHGVSVAEMLRFLGKQKRTPEERRFGRVVLEHAGPGDVSADLARSYLECDPFVAYRILKNPSMPEQVKGSAWDKVDEVAIRYLGALNDEDGYTSNLMNKDRTLLTLVYGKAPLEEHGGLVVPGARARRHLEVALGHLREVRPGDRDQISTHYIDWVFDAVYFSDWVPEPSDMAEIYEAFVPRVPVHDVAFVFGHTFEHWRVLHGLHPDMAGELTDYLEGRLATGMISRTSEGSPRWRGVRLTPDLQEEIIGQANRVEADDRMWRHPLTALLFVHPRAGLARSRVLDLLLAKTEGRPEHDGRKFEMKLYESLFQDLGEAAFSGLAAEQLSEILGSPDAGIRQAAILAISESPGHPPVSPDVPAPRQSLSR